MKHFVPALLCLLLAANAEASIRTGGASSGGGGGGTPGGSDGQLQYNNAGSFGGLTLTGDCTLVYTTGIITCTKTNGSAFANSATVDATNATNISSGNLANARLTAVSANQVLGALTATTPSGLSVPSCSGTTNALTWTSGSGFGCNTIAGSGSGTVTSVTFTGDGILDSATPSTAVTTSGTVTATPIAQAKNTVLAGPTTGSNATAAFRALVGADLPNPAASTLGGVESIASVSHNYLTSISTSGVPAQAQPTTSDLSDIGSFNLNTTGTGTITSTSANAFDVGPAGTTNPTLQVDASTASAANGIVVKSTAAGNGAQITATSSSANEPLTIASKGGGSLFLNGTTSLLLQAAGVSKGQITSSQISWTPGTSNTAATAHWLYTGTADAALTASTEAPQIFFNLGQTRTHATGSLTTQRDFRLAATTHAFAAASTLTTAATLSIDGPPLGGTNATITNAYGLYIPTEVLTNTGTGYGVSVAAPSGATNNYAANFAGDVTFTGNAPAVTSCGGGSIVTGSTDHKGQVSGITAATACTITFSQALGTAPACMLNTNNAIVPTVSSISTAAVTAAMPSMTGTLYYHCF